MNRNRVYDLIKIILFILCFVAIPSVMIITGYCYTWQKNKNTFFRNLSREISDFFTNLESFSDQQKFWCLLFNNNIIAKTKKGKGIKETIENLDNSFKELNKYFDFDYIVYNPKFRTVASLSADCLKGEPDEINIAINTVWKNMNNREKTALDKEIILGKVFGPQFYIEHLRKSSSSELALCWTDSCYKRRLIWAKIFDKCLVMAFIKPESLTDVKSVKSFLEKTKNELPYNFGFSIKDTNKNIFFHSGINENGKLEIESSALIYERDRLREIETEHYYVFPKFLRPGVTIFASFDKKEIKGVEPSLYWIFGLLSTFVLVICLCLYGWNIIWKHQLDKISIKWKLGFLFFFANGIPLLVLMYIGNDFLNQSKTDYIQKIMNEGTSFLQDFDEKFELEYGKSIIRENKIRSSIINKKKAIDKKDLENLYCGISSDTWTLFVVDTNNNILVRNEDGIFDQNDLKKTKDGQYRGSKRLDTRGASKFERHLSQQIQYGQKLGIYLLKKFNNKPVTPKEATEIELMIEATSRNKTEYFVLNIIDNLGSFLPFGFGKNICPALLDSFSLSGNLDYEYLIINTIRIIEFQKRYLDKTIVEVNKNELGLKVVVVRHTDKYIDSYFPKKEKSKELDEFCKRLSPYPLEDAVILKHKGIDYIAMGFEGKHLEECKIIGLYPLSSINDYVSAKRKEFIWISIASIFIMFILSSIIIRSFLKPLSEIYTGAKSNEQKNFQHRLPKLGRDEFGAIGNIFNAVMVDLEELSVAGAIQEQLLPNSSIETGSFSLYGKSVAMGALGGDYYDFIEMEDNKFSVALGDVAGHGVGASLIMAMAKAGLITLDALWKEPQKLISELHNMVYKSKTQKQRKIMTFQYMYLDGNTGEAVYSNAGGCSPLIVRKSSGIVEELKLPGAVLGAFKKGKFSETSINFDVGDAVVFYTDGIVECKNSEGTMLGYDNLKSIFKNCWNENAEIYYKNIYKNYLEYIGGDESKAGDDVTIVVIVFNKTDDSEKELEK